MKKLLVILLISFLSLSIVEFSARWIWKKKYNEWLEKQLHGFDYVDYDRSVIKPTPGMTFTFKSFKDSMIFYGKPLALREVDSLHLADTSIIFRINSQGFKGPEISKVKTGLRILTIGNSCTFGPPIDYYAYPRIIERELLQKNYSVEVINAGVKGYNFDRVMLRLDDLLKYDPDLVTIYLGWNHTIGRADPKKSQWLYRHFDLYKIFYHLIINTKDTDRYAVDHTNTYYDSTDLIFKNYDFSYDMDDLNDLISAIQTKSKAKAAVITLAGLLDYRVKPDAKAIQMEYPIASTNNLFAYETLTQQYNDALRNFVKAHPDVYLFDLETFIFNTFKDRRSNYYVDSVHPNAIGYEFFGKYLADAIEGAIKSGGLFAK